MPTTSAPSLDSLRPELLVFCGIVGLIGSFAPIILNIVASTVAEHDFIADTISDLGRGPHKWIMDTGFYISAAGLIGLAVGTSHAHLGGFRWSVGVFILTFTSLTTVLLGLWDKFGNGEDLSIHTRITFALGPLYLLGPLAMAPALRTKHPRIAASFYASAFAWAVFATWFKLASDNYDGLIEKVAVMFTLLWTVPLALILFRTGRVAADR